ncbi:MAG: SDR family NAD(P)-dependent oxidoreductase [Candidatus Aminicenantes bacterium]|jgi:acyl transferase domain-containing protein/acyl carrier protein
MSLYYQENGLEIAVIGMAGRFPGAKNIEQFWENLKNGIEAITFFSKEELLSAGSSTDLLNNPNYIMCGGGILDNIEYFDAAFFGYSPMEAELADPQARIFHECAWHALENAGYDPFSYDKLIGLYAGAARNLNWEAVSLMSGKASILGDFTTQLLLDRDHLCTRVSYNLNLKGPSVVVKTACSTSLVAIHMACQSILNGECDMALAGGVKITQVKKAGYMSQEGMILSRDGHCRSFDENSMGAVSGDGVGVVVLKRLAEAINDRDTILAVIKGSAVNNDGLRKAGFTAPSIDGQCEVICDALQIAGVDPGTVTCVETHGTGTPVGDPIEFEALKLAFNTPKKQYCRIGSVKTNVGHLGAAAGIAGFIKTVLALKHKLIPPSLHFKNPNSRIDFENSPFIVNTELFEWKNTSHPLRAGVSSFGIGGTNAHVILEEWPDAQGAERRAQSASREYRLILLSARTQPALDRVTENLAGYLKENKDTDLADAAYTLQVGRRTLPYRRMAVCPDVDSAIAALSSPASSKARTSHAKEEKRSVIFMFPGLGSEYVDMGLRLYRTEPVFRDKMDHCFDILDSIVEYNIKAILYPGETEYGNSKASPGFHQPEVVQPVLFIFEYALAGLLMHWGIKPHAMIGYSFGEYTAACLAGVFSLQDALKVIVARGKLIGKLPTGTMLSIPLSREDLKPFITGELSIAIDNGPSCIVAGPGQALELLQNELKKERCLCIPLSNSHAIHSPMMNSILKDFETHLKEIPLNKPQIPYISNITGKWITVGDATNPGYWTAHLKETVRFADGIKQLMKESNPIFIEIGPGRDLSTLLVRHKPGDDNSKYRAISLIKPAPDNTPDVYYFFNKLGQLWIYGVNIDWKEFYKGEQRFRIPLPLYPFEGRRYWTDIEPFKAGETMMVNSLAVKKKDTIDWLYTQQWLRSTLLHRGNGSPSQIRWLLFIDDSPLCNRLVKRLEDDKQHVVVVKSGESFCQLEPGEYTVNPGKPGDYDNLFKTLAEEGKTPNNIAHLWCVSGNRKHPACMAAPDPVLELGLFSLLGIAGAIGKTNISEKIQLGVITGNMQYVTGEEELYPEKAAILGPVKIVPLEHTNISCRSIDIINPRENKGKIEFIIENLLREFSLGFGDQPVVAYRGACRWQESYEPVGFNLDKSSPKETRLKERGVYLITGGFGGMGFVLAEHLVNTLNARLILVDILTPPTGEKLDKWLYSDEREKDIENKKQKIKELESRGAEILVHDMDVSDYQGMKNVISRVEERFGPINGVIHTAGFIDYAGVIQRRTREMTEALLAAKIKGTLVLDELLSHHQLDFMALFSSIGNVFYKIKFGQVGYNAGHEFMDIFSYYKQQQGQFTVTIDWNDWTEVGMGVRAVNRRSASSHNLPENRKESESILSISPAEGIDVFRRILENNLARVVVSHYDLNRLMEVMNNPAEAEAQAGSFHGTDENSKKLHERPELSTDYVPPSDELEQFIVGIWEKAFGFKKIGIMDDLFELGGDSLTIIQIISRVKEVYPVEISLNIFFENPTIIQLARMIKELLFEKIQGLSEEELDALTEQNIMQ